MLRDRGCTRASRILHSIVDPSVSPLEPFLERYIGFPTEPLPDQSVVAVPPPNALRRTRVVAALKLDSGYVLHDPDQLVDGHELGAADIERLDHIALHEKVRPVDAIVDKREAARLLTVAPDLDL